MTSRRDVLRTLGVAALGATLPRSLHAFHGPERALSGIGVQLYTLRSAMRADPEGTLARIASIGFKEIEWWGDFGRTPAQLRALLNQHGLSSPAAHIEPRELQADRLPALLERAQVMGHKHLIVAWTPPAQRNPDEFKRFAALLSEAGRSAASVGIRTGYHNHDFEFVPAGNSTLLDLLITESDPAVVDFELDCFWAFKAGHDPLALLRQHASRITHLHIKDSAGPPAHRQMDVGDGVMDWKAIIDLGTASRVRNVFVEHDEPADAWATVSAGLAHLKRLGY